MRLSSGKRSDETCLNFYAKLNALSFNVLYYLISFYEGASWLRPKTNPSPGLFNYPVISRVNVRLQLSPPAKSKYVEKIPCDPGIFSDKKVI